MYIVHCSNQPEIMELLLKKGADIDVVNKGKCTALHVAVNKQHLMCVRILLKYKCNVNIQVRANFQYSGLYNCSS